MFLRLCLPFCSAKLFDLVAPLFFERCDLIGVFVCEVGCFCSVGHQVVEFPGAIFGFDKFPVAVADGVVILV